MAENVITFPAATRARKPTRTPRRREQCRQDAPVPESPATMTDHRGQPLRRVFRRDDGSLMILSETEARFLAAYSDAPLEAQRYLDAWLRQRVRHGRLRRLRDLQGSP